MRAERQGSGRRRWLALALITLLVAPVGSWWALSSGWTLRQMGQAAKAGDAGRPAAYVDVPAGRGSIREPLKGQLGVPTAGTHSAGSLEALGAATTLRSRKASDEGGLGFTRDNLGWRLTGAVLPPQWIR